MSSPARARFVSPYRTSSKDVRTVPDLVVVEGKTPETRRVAWPLVVVLVLTVVLALGLPLAMNTHMAQRAYEIRDKRVELAELKTETASLERAVLSASSPEQLAEKAASMGLVPAASIGVVSLSEGTVEGGEAAREPEPKDE